MYSIISFELDPDCVVSISPSDEGLFFSQSPNLNHISITLSQFHDCVHLLNQLGSQLYSFAVSIIHVRLSEKFDAQMPLVSSFLHSVISILLNLDILF